MEEGEKRVAAERIADEVTEQAVEKPGEKKSEMTAAGCLALLLGLAIAPLTLWRLALVVLDGPNWAQHLGESAALFLALVVCVGLSPDLKTDEEKRQEQNRKDLEAGILPSDRVAPEELKSGYDLTPEGIASRKAASARAAALASAPSPKKLNKRNRTVCPRCGSSDTFVMGSTNRPSFVRAAVGHAIAGTPGAIVGSMTGKKMRHEFICRSCGKRWRVK